ncbi:MAG: hypothetical protein CFE34_15755 [Rhodobacteraceae bacterium PARR1]|nr:MAG: hypothetical protein CFE34_15755 [Rhodobacteraceae bacterium PARR1]
MTGLAQGVTHAGRAAGPVPVWLMLAVAVLQLAVLVQVTALRDRVVQLEAGSEFQDYAQGCLRPDDPAAPPLTLPAPQGGVGQGQTGRAGLDV